MLKYFFHTAVFNHVIYGNQILYTAHTHQFRKMTRLERHGHNFQTIQHQELSSMPSESQ